MAGGTRGKKDEGADKEDDLVATIRRIIREEVTSRLDEIDKALKSLVEINNRLDTVERGLQHTAERLESAITEILPSITTHIAKLAEGLAEQTLQIDTHRRKWNVILHGVDGPAGEEAADTRASCVTFARDILKVPNVERTRFAACHRLSRKPNAGIIIRFCDLADRDAWFAGAKHLRTQPKKMTLSPDLPPVLRPLKDDLMKTRSELPPETKSKSRVRYLAQWPYVQLKIEGQQPRDPTTDFTTIATSILKVSPLFKIRENTE